VDIEEWRQQPFRSVVGEGVSVVVIAILVMNMIKTVEISHIGEKPTSSSDAHICCICGESFEGVGYYPRPFKIEGVCCADCHRKYVIPSRFDLIFKAKCA